MAEELGILVVKSVPRFLVFYIESFPVAPTNEGRVCAMPTVHAVAHLTTRSQGGDDDENKHEDFLGRHIHIVLPDY